MTTEQLTQAQPMETAPAAQRPHFKRNCAECGTSFTSIRPHARFCSPEHNRIYQNRLQVEGRAIVAMAKAWRLARNAKGNSPEALAIKEVGSKAMSEMCTILDGFISDDRSAGRINPVEYAKQMMGRGFRYMDRQRSR